MTDAAAGVHRRARECGGVADGGAGAAGRPHAARWLPGAPDDPEYQTRVGAFLQGCSNRAGPSAKTCASTLAEGVAEKIGKFIKEIENQVGRTTQLTWSASTIE